MCSSGTGSGVRGRRGDARFRHKAAPADRPNPDMASDFRVHEASASSKTLAPSVAPAKADLTDGRRRQLRPLRPTGGGYFFEVMRSSSSTSWSKSMGLVTY